ncbi:MAG: hypothetical protein OXR82_19920 [Gammaproteobacteria bacterium]|nr:hypothetical protein [Gammaproteobacteria bacterium]MDE0260641.1 hypothetical protein [Gammaproteobacteria bacterium]
MARIFIILAIVLTTAPACSFVLVNGPSPSRRPADPVFCTESRFVPILDTFLAAASAGIAVGIVGAVVTGEVDAGDYGEGLLGAGLGTLAFGTGAAIHTVSAIVGYRRVGRCREAIRNRAPAEAFQLTPSDPDATPPGLFRIMGDQVHPGAPAGGALAPVTSEGGYAAWTSS